jgi:GT2 family glycosyltransferase
MMRPTPSTGGPLVAVVVLNFNGWRDTLACVRSLLDEGSCVRRLVIVCDNGSSDGSFEQLRRGMAPWDAQMRCLTRDEADRGLGALDDAGPFRLVLIQNGANLGFAGGCNVGLRWGMAAGADYLWLLNNDTELQADALGALVRHMQATPAMGLCGSKLIYHDDRSLIQARGGAIYNRDWAAGLHIGVFDPVTKAEDPAHIEAQMDYVVGASMMATRRLIEQIGLMTEDYFLYFEEMDWAMKAKSAGFTLGYASQSVVFHKEGATIGSSHRRRGSSLSMRFMTRNRLLFTRRFFPQHMWAVRKRLMLEILVFLKARDWGAAWCVAESLLGLPVHAPRPLAS